MADKELASIPFFAHEAEASRLERMNRRLWILLVVLVLALIGSNLAWIIYESQFTEIVTTETYEASADGGSTAVTNGSGEVSVNVGYGGLQEDNQNQGAQN